ncbi:hypothetical protein, partial [uncultured Agathobaculum sp.]|uniref:hypothetical protein n=1 Tax=uncultured Agathobaculum sp. TaxID=2048140 RepID=UPI003208596A
FCNFSASFEQKNEVTRLSPLVTFNITTFVAAGFEKKHLKFCIYCAIISCTQIERAMLWRDKRNEKIVEES